ncbi:uncharacterized protein LOC143301512 isoform X2 [Babylonia areolata]|uniref:uncharacterized protein LOC143301512 isoform X2 n=1 Tax=Babylonia areolata TaxID=304850 RepID=UPI003FD33E19
MTLDPRLTWPVLLVLARTVLAAQVGHTSGTVYSRTQGARVSPDLEFSLGTRTNNRTACVVACKEHELCHSVNFHLGDSLCMGTSKALFSFGSNLTAEDGWENFSPQATEVKDGDWVLVFRAQHSVDTTRDEKLLTAWNNDMLRSDDHLDTLPRDCFSPFAGNCADFFRSSLMADWPATVQQVRLVLFTGGVQKVEMVFDGQGSDRESWYSSGRLVSSSFTDMSPGDTNLHFSVLGQLSSNRMFVALTSLDDSTCTQEGWLMVEAEPHNRCLFDRYTTIFSASDFRSPQFLYSNTGSQINFNDRTYKQADVMAIFINLQ